VDYASWRRRLAQSSGQKPSTYAGKRKADGVTRFRSSDVVEQIRRLGLRYFDQDAERFAHWLEVNFKVRDPDKIETAQRAGQIVQVLKGMHDKRAEKEQP